MKTRYYELDLIKTLATLGVVIIHLSAKLQYSNIIERGLWLVILNQISRFSVPAFFIVSGILAVRSYQRLKYKGFIKKRFCDILLPYIIWSLIGLTFIPLHNEDVTVIGVILGNGPFFQLYYLPLLFQMYLLLPIIDKFIKSKKVIISLFVLWLISLLLIELINLNNNELPIWTLYNTFFIWIMYFVVGYYFGKNYESIRRKIVSLRIMPIVMIFSVSVLLLMVDTIIGWKATGSIHGQVHEYFRPIIVIITFSLMVFLIKVASKFKNEVITNISNRSFGIYLVHIAVIKLLYFISDGILFSNGMIGLVSIIICFGLSYLVTSIISYAPFSNLLLGQTISKQNHKKTETI